MGREASTGNVNGLLMTSSAPLGWFDSDSQDDLYKWLIDSGRVQLLPRASTVTNLADWSLPTIQGKWESESINLATTSSWGFVSLFIRTPIRRSWLGPWCHGGA